MEIGLEERESGARWSFFEMFVKRGCLRAFQKLRSPGILLEADHFRKDVIWVQKDRKIFPLIWEDAKTAQQVIAYKTQKTRLQRAGSAWAFTSAVSFGSLLYGSLWSQLPDVWFIVPFHLGFTVIAIGTWADKQRSLKRLDSAPVWYKVEQLRKEEVEVFSLELYDELKIRKAYDLPAFPMVFFHPKKEWQDLCSVDGKVHSEYQLIEVVRDREEESDPVVPLSQ